MEDILKYLYEKMERGRGKIQIGLELDKSTLENVIALCITRYPISTDIDIGSNHTLKELQRCMILFFEKITSTTSIVNIPLVVLSILFQHLNHDHFMNTLGLGFDLWLAYGTNFELFETFNHKFLTIRLNSLQLLANRHIIPTEIGLDCVFNSAASNYKINLQHSKFNSVALSYHYPKSSSGKESVGTVYKNGSKTPFADIFLVLKCEKNLFCYIQVRHTEKVTSKISETNKAIPITQEEIDEELQNLVQYDKNLKEQWGNDVELFYIYYKQNCF